MSYELDERINECKVKIEEYTERIDTLKQNIKGENKKIKELEKIKGKLAAGGEDAQAKLLEAEGIEVKNGKVDLKRFGI